MMEEVDERKLDLIESMRYLAKVDPKEVRVIRNAPSNSNIVGSGNATVFFSTLERELEAGAKAQEQLDKVRRVLGVMLSQGTIDKETVEMGLGFKVQVEVV